MDSIILLKTGRHDVAKEILWYLKRKVLNPARGCMFLEKMVVSDSWSKAGNLPMDRNMPSGPITK